ncbi:PAS domain-containing sensor histidine kinase [Persicimonas caeni]|uniref:PAS domain-containing sensor histidine kinase n=1 Tax=Persicimonas caeni TaxID=2292766 RepID=UPI00143CFA8C|nr:PAS domain S-box protein [Persicimonas caeni]
MTDTNQREHSSRADSLPLANAAEARRRSEARYQTLFDSVDEGICILEVLFDEQQHPVDCCVLEMNPTFEQLTGLSDTEGRTARELAPDMDTFWFDVFGKVALSGEPEHFEHPAPDRGCWFGVRVMRVGEPRSRQVAVFFRDITERKQINDALRERERYFRSMADTAPAMLWVTGTNNQCTFLSRGWYDYTGQTEQEGLGFGWVHAVHPDDRQRARELYLKAAEQREPFKFDYRLRGTDGKYRWAIDSGRPRFDADGNWLGYIGSVIDVHERKESEQALRRADTRKDRFIALLSHELRNPLAPIQLSLDLLDHVPAGSPRASRALEVIERQIGQLTGLVDELLDVTRVTSDKIRLHREVLALDELLKDTVEDHRQLFLERDVALDLELCDEPAPVWGDRHRLCQVVGNLLQNAAKFTDPGGHVVVELSVCAETGRAEICVRDSGVGMDETTLANLFEPFIQADTSLDRSSGGLGLGLALVKGLTELHGGQVGVESEGRGQGARFSIWLPLTDRN